MLCTPEKPLLDPTEAIHSLADFLCSGDISAWSEGDLKISDDVDVLHTRFFFISYPVFPSLLQRVFTLFLFFRTLNKISSCFGVRHWNWSVFLIVNYLFPAKWDYLAFLCF